MLDLDLTMAISHLCDGKASVKEQKVCGTVFKAILENKGVKPNFKNDKPYCPKCNQPINTKVKDGKHIYEYCKCCGQHINWEGEAE